MTKGKGYLLPSGDASEDDLECCIVFYPARDEYRRALMGSLDYLATWIAWERDSEKRGQDAAASWKLANIQTWECTNMGYCDDLATTLQALLAATQALECCGEQDITDGLQYTDDIVDGVGDVPQNIIDAGYASGTSDWAGFDDYKCMISHLAVDHIETFFREISPYVSDTGIVIGGVGVVGALLGAILVVVGLPIAAGIIFALGAAAGIWTWIATYGRDAVDDLADDIATHHDALACAIYEGDGVTDAIADFEVVVDALFSTIDAIAIKAVGFEPQLRAMYAGRYDQQDIADNLDTLGYETVFFVCDCVTETPPKSGWHLEYPETLVSFRDFINCTDAGSTYNPATGILDIKLNVSAAAQMEMRARFDTGSGFGLGCVMEVLGYTLPTKLQEQGRNLLSGVIFDNEVFVDDKYAGLRTDILNPADPDWAAWLAQYDFIHHMSGGSPETGDFELGENGTTQTGFYRITVRIRRLEAD